MTILLIENGNLFCPEENVSYPGHIVVKDGIISYIGKDLQKAKSLAGSNAQVYDAKGKLVTPGLIDIHVHFREPGNEAEETIASGSAAAVAGGFTSVVCMANTDPAVDTEAAVNFVTRESNKAGLANVYTVGAVTQDRKGTELAEMAQMARAGAVAFSDDGVAVPTAGLLRRALSYAKMLGKPILEHCEDKSLTGEGVMDEGYMSTVLGLKGIPDESEEVIVARDVAIAGLTGGHIHIQHVSTANSVEIIRRAKAAGVMVTAEVAPHHLLLTSDLLRNYDSVYKVSPPLRAAHDVAACRSGLKAGIIDAIASDHAPHLREEKELQINDAPCGMIGLEATLGVLLTELYHTKEFTLAEIIKPLTAGPSDVLKLNRGRLKVGLPGDITIIDLDREWVVDPDKFYSLSRNCPYKGWTLKGRTVATVVAGKVVFDINNSKY